MENTLKQRKRDAKKLDIVIVTVIIYFFAELYVGIFYNSLALLADAFHMLTDSIALVISRYAIKIAERSRHEKLGNLQNTFGWSRCEIVATLINSVSLMVICMMITLEAIERFLEPEIIEKPAVVLYTGLGGFLINGFSLLILGDAGHGHSHDGDGHDHGHGHSHSHENHHSHTHSHQISQTPVKPSSKIKYQTSITEAIEEEENNTCTSSNSNNINIKVIQNNHNSSPRTENEQISNNQSNAQLVPSLEKSQNQKISQSDRTSHSHSHTPTQEPNTQLTNPEPHTHAHSHHHHEPHKHEKRMNVDAAFMHVLGDFLGSIIVIVTACIQMYFHCDRIYSNVIEQTTNFNLNLSQNFCYANKTQNQSSELMFKCSNKISFHRYEGDKLPNPGLNSMNDAGNSGFERPYTELENYIYGNDARMNELNLKYPYCLDMNNLQEETSKALAFENPNLTAEEIKDLKIMEQTSNFKSLNRYLKGCLIYSPCQNEFLYIEPTWAIYVDPTLTALLVMLLVYVNLPYTKRPISILLDTVPQHIDKNELEDKVLAVKNVCSIKCFHLLDLEEVESRFLKVAY